MQFLNEIFGLVKWITSQERDSIIYIRFQTHYITMYCYIIESFIIIRFSSRVFPVGKNDYYDGGFILIFSGLQTANNILRNVMYKISTIGCPFFDDDKFSHETGKQVMLAEIPGEVVKFVFLC